LYTGMTIDSLTMSPDFPESVDVVRRLRRQRWTRRY
jgi:hypothetical protein